MAAALVNDGAIRSGAFRLEKSIDAERTREVCDDSRTDAETVSRYHIKRAYYWIKAGNITYVLVNSWAVGFHAAKAPLNLTVNGKVKIFIEGQNAFVLDDSGMEIKRPIVAKDCGACRALVSNN
jgi:hypothetical protein